MICRTEEPPKELAQSSSPLVKGLKDPLEAVKHSIDHVAAQLPAGTTSPEAAQAAPAPAVQAGPAAPPKTQSQERAAHLTQATAVRAADADAIKQVRNVLSLRRHLHVQCLTLVMHGQKHLHVRQFGMGARKQLPLAITEKHADTFEWLLQVLSPSKVALQADTQKVAASVQPAQTASFAKVPATAINNVETPAPEKKAWHSESIFDLAVRLFHNTSVICSCCSFHFLLLTPHALRAQVKQKHFCLFL